MTTIRRYSDQEAAALSALAAEARELEAQARDLLTHAGEIIDRVAGFDCTINGKAEHHTDPRWSEYPELAQIAAATAADFRVAPYAQLPQAGQVACKRFHSPAKWQTLNNRTRREIARLQVAIANYGAN